MDNIWRNTGEERLRMVIGKTKNTTVVGLGAVKLDIKVPKDLRKVASKRNGTRPLLREAVE